MEAAVGAGEYRRAEQARLEAYAFFEFGPERRLQAFGVLLLITNWFFHRVYWSEWMARFHRRRKALERIDKAGLLGFLSAQAAGLAILGLTSVYREGVKTVLFLQSLQLSAGTVAVLEGAGLGLALTLAVAVATFALQRKLPYKRMLVYTGVMIGLVLVLVLVLVVMVGQTARRCRARAGCRSPASARRPYWLGLWFGVYPTWETLGAQVASSAFVIGSFFLAKELQVKRRQRRAGTQQLVRSP
jgi:high-affinity iron transporter